jgi:hypothetical protein
MKMLIYMERLAILYDTFAQCPRRNEVAGAIERHPIK